MENEKYIKQMFEGIDIEHELDLEYKIMTEIENLQDHSMIINRYKLISKIGLIISTFLAIIIGYLYVIPMFSKGHSTPNNTVDIFTPYLYSITTLLTIYIQLEFYHFKNKKGSQI